MMLKILNLTCRPIDRGDPVVTSQLAINSKKTRLMRPGDQLMKERIFDDMFSRFDTLPDHDGCDCESFVTWCDFSLL